MSKSKKKISARSHKKSTTSKLDWFKQLSYYNKTTIGLFFLAVALPYFGWLVGSFLNPDGLFSVGTWKEIIGSDGGVDKGIDTWLYIILSPVLVGVSVLFFMIPPVGLLMAAMFVLGLSYINGLTRGDHASKRSKKFRGASYVLCALSVVMALTNFIVTGYF